MAQRMKYEEAQFEKVVLRLQLENGKEVVAEGYECIYFLDGIPEGKHDYYTRHDEHDWSEPVSIKSNKGLTVNFWGTIVTNEPLDFSECSEIDIQSVEFVYE